MGRATGGWLLRHAAAPINSTRQIQSSDFNLIDVVVTMSKCQAGGFGRSVQFDQLGYVLFPARVI